VAGDTSQVGFTGLSGGSKVLYTTGRAVERAARQAREKLLTVAATELEISADDLEIVDGAVQPRGVPGRATPITELARKVLSFGSPHEPVEGYAGVAQTSRAPSAAAHVSRVRVDRDTGQVEALEHLVVQDVGRPLNPALVEGQLVGGTVQGLGWALLEELVHDADGQLRNGSLVEYVMPSFDRVPPIHVEIVEVPAPDGPFGAKGIGEAPVIAVPAAVANAVAAATGVRPRALPITSERLWAALRDADGDA
ncbi:MAG TPA: molybdopterin cofactor-binding domain-containing protein, partial [Solirubrobacteraceae bacterium]|jgi:CO/xanthine dehydrogenase Mo-binding subunit